LAFAVDLEVGPLAQPVLGQFDDPEGALSVRLVGKEETIIPVL
jgi:hypothetical protein